jgi:hypothetical protein
MDIETIDQAPSEERLHRVLWLVKFLRAFVLHVLLGLLAALVYFATGTDDLYPIADDIIRLSKALARESTAQPDRWYLMGYAVAVWIVFAAMLALLIWIYRSIVDVRRRALKIQAVLFLIIYSLATAGKWEELEFAYEKLDVTFAVLATIGTVITMLVFPLAIVVALWVVSRTPETSSFVATLDARLAPDAWAYWNKLLDLPRTPLRTLALAAAYVLALSGALLLIGSLMYLLTAGSTPNKLGLLFTLCKSSDKMPDCVTLSSAWVQRVSTGLVLAMIGVAAASLLQAAAKRLGGLSVADVLKKPTDRFGLFLRPFDTDAVILPKPLLPLLSSLLSFRPFPVRIEEELFDVADGYRPLIAVGKPGGSKDVQGGLAYRTFLEHADWKEYVADKIRCAERIVIVVKDTEGVRWELARILREGAAPKTLFLYDPAIRTQADWDALAKMWLPLLQEAGLASPALTLEARPIGFFFAGGKMIEIVNANRTATSYRTAFSYFLASARWQDAPTSSVRQGFRRIPSAAG